MGMIGTSAAEELSALISKAQDMLSRVRADAEIGHDVRSLPAGWVAYVSDDGRLMTAKLSVLYEDHRRAQESVRRGFEQRDA